MAKLKDEMIIEVKTPEDIDQNADLVRRTMLQQMQETPIDAEHGTIIITSSRAKDGIRNIISAAGPRDMTLQSVAGLAAFLTREVVKTAMDDPSKLALIPRVIVDLRAAVDRGIIDALPDEFFALLDKIPDADTPPAGHA